MTRWPRKFYLVQAFGLSSPDYRKVNSSPGVMSEMARTKISKQAKIRVTRGWLSPEKLKAMHICPYDFLSTIRNKISYGIHFIISISVVYLPPYWPVQGRTTLESRIRALHVLIRIVGQTYVDMWSGLTIFTAVLMPSFCKPSSVLYARINVYLKVTMKLWWKHWALVTKMLYILFLSYYSLSH